MILDLWQYRAGTWPGFVIVIDLDRMTLGHLARLDIQSIQQFLYYLQVIIIITTLWFSFDIVSQAR